MQFRTGVRLLIRVPVASATVISPGDLLSYDGAVATPAADFPWTTDAATTRAAFAAEFLGVAYSASADGETDAISVDVSPMAFYEADSDAPITAIGEALGPAADGLALSSRVLASVPVGEAIGRVVKASPLSTNRLGASFASAKFSGSANVNAGVG